MTFASFSGLNHKSLLNNDYQIILLIKYYYLIDSACVKFCDFNKYNCINNSVCSIDLDT